MARRARTLIAVGASALLALAAVTASPAQAAPRGQGFVATPNGLAGVQQEIVVFAPSQVGQPVTIGLANGPVNQVLQSVVNNAGYAYYSWTPTAAGTWIVSALGTAISSGNTTISVAALPTTTVLEAPNFAQQGAASSLQVYVVAPSGTLPPTGTVVVNDANTNAVVGTGTLNPLAGTAVSSVRIPWTPQASGVLTYTATYTSDSSAFTSSTSGYARPSVSTAAVTVALEFPPSMNQGTPTVISAVLGAGVADGSVAFLMDGQGISGSMPTVNGIANLTWAPTVAGVHTITVTFTGQKNISGSSSQTINIGGPLPKDSITVDPQPGPVWSPAAPIVMQTGSSVVLGTSATSGATVTLAENGPCTLNGAALTARAAGQCQVIATSVGSVGYTGTSQTYTITVQNPPKRARR